MKTTVHVRPFDIAHTFCFNTWGFTLTFRGRKGEDGKGQEIDVVLHFSASWIDYIVGKLKEILALQETQVIEARNSMRLP